MYTYKLKRKASTEEWVVVVYLNGRRCEERCYYTDDRQDAVDTMRAMQADERDLAALERARREMQVVGGAR